MACEPLPDGEHVRQLQGFAAHGIVHKGTGELKLLDEATAVQVNDAGWAILVPISGAASSYAFQCTEYSYHSVDRDGIIECPFFKC